jgi:Glycosyl transferase family 2
VTAAALPHRGRAAGAARVTAWLRRHWPAVAVRTARRSLAALGVAGKVLVSDNGSLDGSPRIAADSGARVISAPIPGYGGAPFAGIEDARGRYVIMADADDSYDVARLGPFVTALRAVQTW